MTYILMPDRVRVPPMRADSDDYHRLPWTRQPGEEGVLHVSVVGRGDPSLVPQGLAKTASADVLPALFGGSEGEGAVRLRDYQRECIQAISSAWERSVRSPLVVLPTGAGKTIIAARLMELEFGRRGHRSVFAAHRKELLSQTVEKVNLVTGSSRIVPRVGTVQGTRNELGRDITVASVQTLGGSRSGRRLQALIDAGPYNILVCDEAHHAVSPQWQRLISGLREAFPEMQMFGMTATPGRADGTALDTVFDEVVYEKNLLDMIQMGYLVPPKGFKVELNLNLDAVATSGGDFVQTQLSKLMNQPPVNRAVVEAWRGYGHNRKTIIFAVDVDHAAQLAEEFRDAGYASEHVFGAMKTRERTAAFKRFREGETKVLVNCEIATEGFDEPSIECVLFARPTQSQALYIQCLDAQTEVLTQRGWLGPDDVSNADQVGTLNTETRLFEWSPVLSHVDRPLHPDEHMYALSLPSVDIRVTGKHRMIYAQRDKLLWSVAEALPKCFKLPVAAPSDCPDNECISDEMLTFLGWWYSEGSYNKTTNALHLYQSADSPFINDIEGAIRSTGFKYGRHENVYDTQFKANHRMVSFTISHGSPRGRDKHKTGWSPVSSWIPTDGTKRPVPMFWSLSTRQLLVFLRAFNKGDGARLASPSIDYTPRSWRIYQKVGIGFHDEIQALCVSRGIRCNIYETVVDGKPYKVLGITPNKTVHTVNGSRPELTMHRTVRLADERVWCLETVTGTLVTRRNGRVAIVGNCLGRGLRLYPGKTECLVIDCVGNSERHRPVQLASLAGFDPERRVGNGSSGSGDGSGEDEAPVIPEVVGSNVRGSEFDLTGRRATTRYQWRETKYGWVLQIPRVGYYLVAWDSKSHVKCTIRFYDQRPGRRDVPPVDVHKYPIEFEMAYGMVEAEMDRILNARSARGLSRRRDGGVYEDPHRDNEFQTKEREPVPEINFVDLDEGTEEQLEVPETLLMRDAGWRSAKASEKQLKLLKDLGVKGKAMPETAGEASDLITIMRIEKDARMRMPMTSKQIAYFKVNELPLPDPPTKGKAANIIWRHRKATGY